MPVRRRADRGRRRNSTQSFDYFWLQPKITESLSRSNSFPVDAAGTYTFNLRGVRFVNSCSRYGLTVVLFPG